MNQQKKKHERYSTEQHFDAAPTFVPAIPLSSHHAWHLTKWHHKPLSALNLCILKPGMCNTRRSSLRLCASNYAYAISDKAASTNHATFSFHCVWYLLGVYYMYLAYGEVAEGVVHREVEDRRSNQGDRHIVKSPV